MESAHDTINFRLAEEEELNDIHYNCKLRLNHSELFLDSFWILLRKEYSNIGERPLILMLQFSASREYQKQEKRKTLSNTRPNFAKTLKIRVFY